MPSPAAEAPTPSSRGSTSAMLVILTLAAILLSAPLVKAASFPVSQEQVLVGTTDGIAGVQAEDGLRETMREADTAPDPLSYAGTQTLSKGWQVSGTFPANVQSSDGIYIDYRETTTAPVVVQSNPAAVDPGCTWTLCANGMLSDNNYATSAAGGDYAVYTNFSFSIPLASVITQVEVGYEAFDATGNDRLAITISWDGGVTWCPAKTPLGLPSADPNAYAYLDFTTTCNGHSWVASDFGGNISTTITHSAQGPPETIDLDANVVRVTYQPQAYELDLQYNWTGVAAGQRYDLLVKGHVSDENVSIQVLTPPSTWTSRLTLSSATDQVLGYTLSPSEIGSGNASIRFLDALGPDPVASDLWIDGAVILTAVYAYHLDVVQTVTGISGANPSLAVGGNISAGGENFNVLVWNFTAANWTVKMTSVFTQTNEVHEVALLPEEINNGTVRIDYQDQDPASIVPGILMLDFVQVVTPSPASSLTGILLVGGAITAVAAIALFVFFVVLPRRRSPSDASAAAPNERTPSAGLRAKDGSPSPAPEVAMADLRPGGAYLVDEQKPAAAVRALERLTRMGRSGLLVTRRDPLTVTRMFKLRHTKTVWLGDSSGSGSGQVFAVSLEAVETAVGDFLRTNPVGVVLIDGMKDLVDGNDFPSVLQFIRQTVENVSSGQQILLVSLPRGVLRGRELKLIAQELDIVRIV